MRFKQLTGLHFIAICMILSVTSAHDLAIRAIKDQVAFIPCHAFTQAKKISGPLTLIRWLHSSFHKPLYTLDVRSQNASLFKDTSFLHKGRHFPSPESEGRLYLDLSLDPIGLRIDPVFKEDAGIYTCKIDFKNRRSIHSALELLIIVPPKDAIIRDTLNKTLEGVIGPYHLGETVLLKCESSGGNPKPISMWKSSNSDLPGVMVNESQLIIHSLEIHHQWSHYTCSVQNSNMTAPKSVTVTIELFLPPLDLLLQSNIPQPLIAGQSVVISCLTFGSYPKAHIYWMKNNEKTTAEERITDSGNLTTSFIEFIVQSSDDEKEIECSSMNPVLENNVLRKIFVMNVYYKPEINIAILSNQSQISEGQNFVLLCNIRANPKVQTILWYFENKEIVNDSSVVILRNKLYIKYLTQRYSGTFGCQAANEYGIQHSSVLIAVKHKPVCRETQISYSYGQEIDDANVTCNLVSYPSDVTFYWTLRNTSSNHSWSTGQVPHTRIELQKPNTELLCWGGNEIGVQISPCKILLVKAVEAKLLFLPVIIISISVITIFIIAVFIVVRKYRLRFKLSSTSSSDNEIIQLKDMDYSNKVLEILLYVSLYVTVYYFIIMKTHYYDSSCGKLITKCVKQQSTANTENDSSAKLLDKSRKFSSGLGTTELD